MGEGQWGHGPKGLEERRVGKNVTDCEVNYYNNNNNNINKNYQFLKQKKKL